MISLFLEEKERARTLILPNFIKKSDRYFTVDTEELSLASNTNKDVDLVIDNYYASVSHDWTTILKLPMKFYKSQVGNMKEYSCETV